jgi:hypothetical protein
MMWSVYLLLLDFEEAVLSKNLFYGSVCRYRLNYMLCFVFYYLLENWCHKRDSIFVSAGQCSIVAGYCTVEIN